MTLSVSIQPFIHANESIGKLNKYFSQVERKIMYRYIDLLAVSIFATS